MRPNISEFSYGFAITDELIHWHGTTITAAPVFPSLYWEGQPGGGYDVMLQRPGIPLFLQFKLSHRMERTNAREARMGLLPTPYYRMHIRPSRHSDQHEMLLDLENLGNEVYYSAPAFHQPWELNSAYLGHNVRGSSVWIRPSWIGLLPDETDHYIVFRLNGPTYFCSKPQLIQEPSGFEDFTASVIAKLRQRGEVALKRQRLYELAEQIAVIARKRRDIGLEEQYMLRDEIQAREPIEQVAFYSHMFLEAQLFIVHEREG